MILLLLSTSCVMAISSSPKISKKNKKEKIKIKKHLPFIGTNWAGFQDN